MLRLALRYSAANKRREKCLSELIGNQGDVHYLAIGEKLTNSCKRVSMLLEGETRLDVEYYTPILTFQKYCEVVVLHATRDVYCG